MSVFTKATVYCNSRARTQFFFTGYFSINIFANCNFNVLWSHLKTIFKIKQCYPLSLLDDWCKQVLEQVKWLGDTALLLLPYACVNVFVARPVIVFVFASPDAAESRVITLMNVCVCECVFLFASRCSWGNRKCGVNRSLSAAAHRLNGVTLKGKG